MGILAIGGTLRAVGGTLRVVGQADPVDPPPPDPVQTVLEEATASWSSPASLKCPV